jgi:hypothetical protein
VGENARGKWGGGSARACHATEGEREKEGAARGRNGSGWSGWRLAGEQGRVAGRGRRGMARPTGGAGRQRGPVSAAGCRRERGK